VYAKHNAKNMTVVPSKIVSIIDLDSCCSSLESDKTKGALFMSAVYAFWHGDDLPISQASI
jgi:hypothetical protein